MKELYTAILNIQKDCPRIIKDAEAKIGSKFSYTYAKLEKVYEIVVPKLQENKLIHIGQQICIGDKEYMRITLIQIETAQSIWTDKLLINCNDMQQQGSAGTYARRYGLLELLGLATEDDDGAGANADDAKGTDVTKPQDIALIKHKLAEILDKKRDKLSSNLIERTEILLNDTKATVAQFTTAIKFLEKQNVN